MSGQLEHYETFLRGVGRSERWITDSLSAVRLLERHADRHVQEVTELDVLRFLGRDGLSPGSRYTYHGFLLGFFRWWGDHGGVNVMAAIPRPKLPRSEPRPVTPDQLRRLLDTRMRRRTRVMILLAALAGLRVHEIAQVRGEDVDTVAGTLFVTGKGGHRATIPLHPALAEVAATMPRRGWWFPSNSRCPGQHVQRRSVGTMIQRAMDRADVPASAHQLRHYFGTALVRSGTDLRTVQTLMRHASIQTTQVYVQVTDRDRIDAVGRLDPFGRAGVTND